MTSLYKVLLANLGKLGVSLFISMSLGVFLKAYMPRALGVENIGLFYFADSLSFIFFTFLPLGVHTFVNRVIPPDPQKIFVYYRSILVFMLCFAVVLYLFYTGYVYFLGDKTGFLPIILCVGVFQAFHVLTKDILKPIFIAADQVNFVSRMDIQHKVGQVSLVCLSLLLHPDLLLVSLMFVLSLFITFAFYLGKSFSLGWQQSEFRWSHCKQFIIVGLPFFINSALLSFYGNIDITMLEHFGTHEEVGWYGSSQQLKGIFMMIVPLLQSVIMPLLSKQSSLGEEAFLEFVQRIYWALIFLSWLLSAGMALFSFEIVPLLFGQPFQPAVNSVILLAPVILFTYMNVFLSLILNLISSGKGMIVVTSISLGLNALLNIYMIPWGLKLFAQGGGGIGASITTIVAEVFVFAALLYITPLKILTWKNVILSLITFLGAGLVSYFLIIQPDLSPWLRGALFLLIILISITLAFVSQRDIILKFLNHYRAQK